MNVWPGGDAYFGALLNSSIHVMMYSYYALSLLKIRCPWKKYLTQAQLIQFLSVIVYTVVSYLSLKNKATWSQQTAWIVQAFEMASMFFLFLRFYAKAYSKKKQRKSLEDSASADATAEQASLSSSSTDEADEQQQAS